MTVESSLCGLMVSWLADRWLPALADWTSCLVGPPDWLDCHEATQLVCLCMPCASCAYVLQVTLWQLGLGDSGTAAGVQVAAATQRLPGQRQP
jgi:hypothetical protein